MSSVGFIIWSHQYRFGWQDIHHQPKSTSFLIWKTGEKIRSFEYKISQFITSFFFFSFFSRAKGKWSVLGHIMNKAFANTVLAMSKNLHFQKWDNEERNQSPRTASVRTPSLFEYCRSQDTVVLELEINHRAVLLLLLRPMWYTMYTGRVTARRVSQSVNVTSPTQQRTNGVVAVFSPAPLKQRIGRIIL